MTRIVAGAARGRRLAVPPTGTRPTADRAREALFSALASLVGTPLGGGDALDGLGFLDLYAGSGAVGLEALSRGAARVTLVERDRAAADVIAGNIEAVGLPGADLHRRAVEQVVKEDNPGDPYDLVFADPPYDLPGADLGRVLDALVRHGWVGADAVVVVERAARTPWAWPEGFVAERDRRYGEATLWYGRAAG